MVDVLGSLFAIENGEFMDQVGTKPIDLERIRQVLDQVKDPEIPAVSVLEMGMIAGVESTPEKTVIRMTPTFAACPAIDLMKSNICEAMTAAGFKNVLVNIVFDPPWSTDRITQTGLAKLEAFGLAPPRRLDNREVDAGLLVDVPCPFCSSKNTTMESPFGSALCRSIHYCNDCLQTFEHIKPVG